jgi:lipoprotein-anchoring transpeptidase ErfK/SrfK
LRNPLNQLANAHPFKQALAILTLLLVVALAFEAWGLLFSPPPKHHVAKKTVVAAPPPTPTATASDLPSPTQTAAVPIPVSSTVATAQGKLVVARTQPNAKAKVVQSISPHNLIGQDTPFLVLDSQPGWWRVQLPVAPNGTTGWVSTDQVATSTVGDFILATLSTYRLDHYRDGKLVDSFPIGVGVPATPTPTGTFYVWAIQDAPGPPYDPVILGLSAHSPTLSNWPYGGIVGVHGWADTSVEGKQISNGCLRMKPADVSKLEQNLPLGTPIQIID